MKHFIASVAVFLVGLCHFNLANASHSSEFYDGNFGFLGSETSYAGSSLATPATVANDENQGALGQNYILPNFGNTFIYATLDALPAEPDLSNSSRVVKVGFDIFFYDPVNTDNTLSVPGAMQLSINAATIDYFGPSSSDDVGQTYSLLDEILLTRAIDIDLLAYSDPALAGMPPEITSLSFSELTTTAASGSLASPNPSTSIPVYHIETQFSFISLSGAGDFNLEVIATQLEGLPGMTFGIDNLSLDWSTPISAVPVPGAVWLFLSGLLGMAGVARQRHAK